jgi:Ca2+-binding EF-hand superfamily protein
MKNTVALAALAAAALPTLAADPQAEAFNNLDKNRDGKITAAEFVDRVLAQAFTEFDRNRDGKIDAKEWAKIERGPEAKDDFAELDHDKNGTLSRDEFTLHPGKRAILGKVFLTVDPNDDGKLTVKELPANQGN